MNEVLPIDNIVVVKIGTSVLADTYPDGRQELNLESFRRIGKDILSLETSGMHVVIVTSAAITAGMAEGGLTKRPDKATAVPELQRLSSIGWRPLLNAWDDALPGRATGSLQLTRHELDSVSSERSEALQTTYSLLNHGQTPIVNENDAITHSEIAFGDNDTLAATYATHMARSALFGNNIRVVLLSDVHGVYKDKDDPTSVIRTIVDIDDYEHLAGNAGSDNGTGGMKTKFAAARIVTRAGLAMYITHGRTDNAIRLALDGEIGTVVFPPNLI